MLKGKWVQEKTKLTGYIKENNHILLLRQLVQINPSPEGADLFPYILKTNSGVDLQK